MTKNLDQLLLLTNTAIEQHEKIERLEQKLEKAESFISEVANEVEQRYKFLLQEQQVEDSKLEAKMTKVQNAVGYCLRKVREAVDTDPQSAYLKQILDAVQDLDQKIK